MKRPLRNYIATVHCKVDDSTEQVAFRCTSEQEFKELVMHLYYCTMDDLVFKGLRFIEETISK